MPIRRFKGDGSIRKRADGRWEARWTVGYEPDTRKQIVRTVYGKTLSEVQEKLTQTKITSKHIDWSRTGLYTVDVWVRLWFETYSKHSVKERTALSYWGIIRHHICPCIGKVKLNKLTTLEIQRFYNREQKSGLSSSTVRHIHTVLHQALDQAVNERLILTNPAKDCRLPKIEKQDMRVLTAEEVGAYLREAARRGMLPIFFLELTTGLRQGELLALLWTDLDIEKRQLSVSKSLFYHHVEFKVTMPKTKYSIRTIALSWQTVELLIAEHQKHPDNPYMFPSPVTGQMYSHYVISRLHKKILKAAGLEYLRFHDLRHTYATLALQNGVDVKTLSGILGHFSAGFTLDTYTHTSDEKQHEAAEKMGQSLK